MSGAQKMSEHAQKPETDFVSVIKDQGMTLLMRHSFLYIVRILPKNRITERNPLILQPVLSKQRKSMLFFTTFSIDIKILREKTYKF